ncbi:MAG: SDR family NAD(P)-dependent oxidoreductase [Planctomycetales bacterium]|nr:SDR family NAD(P)-dependent oxidoreductase [Planctomycetales bacterium]
MKSLQSKRALVTGAASGIGRAIALALAREGAHVCLLDINQTGLAKAAKEVESIGGRVLSIHCDLSNKQEISAAVEELLTSWGGLEILVNNGGVLHYGPTHLMTEYQRQFAPALSDRNCSRQGHRPKRMAKCDILQIGHVLPRSTSLERQSAPSIGIAASFW